IPSPIEYEYRNRITVHVREGVVGFFRRESNKLLDIERCPIALNDVNARLVELRESRPRDGHYTLRASAGPRAFTQANDAVAAAINRSGLAQGKRRNHHGPACDGPEQNDSRNADRTPTSPVDLRILQSRHSGAGPCRIERILSHRFDHALGYVPSNSRNRVRC